MKLVLDQVEAMASGASRACLAVVLYVLGVGMGAGVVWGLGSELLLYWWFMLIENLMHPVGLVYYPASAILVYRLFDNAYSLAFLFVGTIVLNCLSALAIEHINISVRPLVLGLSLLAMLFTGAWLKMKRSGDRRAQPTPGKGA